MNVYTGHELVALAINLHIAEDDLWKYLNRAIENGQIDQYYLTEDDATNGDDFNSEYEFKKYSAIEFLAIIPTTV